MTPEQKRILAEIDAKLATPEDPAAPVETPQPPPGVRPAEDGYMVDERAVGAGIARNNPAVGAAGNFMAGLPFVGEFTDEAIGAATGDPYMTERSRGATEQFERDRPNTAMAARVAGGVTGALPLAAAAPFSLGGAIGSRVATGAGLGAAAGAVEGAASGAGAGTDPKSRLREAGDRFVTGGLVGGVAGGATPLVMEGGKAVARGVNRLLTPAARAPGVSKEASETLSDILARDRAFGGGPGAGRIHTAGPDAMLADAGPSSRGVLDTAIQKGGAGVDAAMDAVEGRAGKAGRDIADSFDSLFGPAQGARTTERGIRDSTKAARSTAYNDAYAQPIDYAADAGRQLEEMFDRIPGDVVAKANRLMKVGGDRSKQILADVADDGSITFKVMPDTRQLDYITRALNEIADEADGMGKLGGQTPYGAAVRNLARDLRGALKDANPAYATALETAADPISRRAALRFGADDFLKRNVTRDEVEEFVQGMSGPELGALKQGIRSRLDDTMAQVTRAVADGNMDAREATKVVKELSSRFNQDKFGLILNDAEMDALNGVLDRAAASIELRGSVATGSRTYGRQAADELVKRQMTTPLAHLQQGEPVKALRTIPQRLFGGSPADVAAREDRVYGDLAEALTRRNPQTILQALEQSGQSRQNLQPLIEALDKASRRGGVVAYGGGAQTTR